MQQLKKKIVGPLCNNSSLFCCSMWKALQKTDISYISNWYDWVMWVGAGFSLTNWLENVLVGTCYMLKWLAYIVVWIFWTKKTEINHFSCIKSDLFFCVGLFISNQYFETCNHWFCFWFFLCLIFGLGTYYQILNSIASAEWHASKNNHIYHWHFANAAFILHGFWKWKTKMSQLIDNICKWECNCVCTIMLRYFCKI